MLPDTVALGQVGFKELGILSFGFKFCNLSVLCAESEEISGLDSGIVVSLGGV